MKLQHIHPLLLLLLGGTLFSQTNSSELWFNPVTKKYERVVIEDPSEANASGDANAPGGQKPVGKQKTEIYFNPVTKKYESVLVENAPPQQSNGALTPPQSLDNGLPIATAKDWSEIDNDKTSRETRTYKNDKTGQVVEFNPTIAELWLNPVKGLYEPVLREPVQQSTYLKQVARELAMKQKPLSASGWRCNLSGTVHGSPFECADPDQGGSWVTR